MKSILFTLFFSLITNLIYCQINNGPEITLGQDVFDFGTVSLSKDTLIASFYFKNTGSDTLVIENVRPSCGCTVADFSKNPILPGEGGVIILKYSRTTEGPINKSATILSNAVANPYKVIRLKGQVKKQ